MTLYDFIRLDEMEQMDAVWDGVLLGEREDEQYKIKLYQIDSFYVEAYYGKDNPSVVREFRPFASTNPLAPYLDQINISDLLSKK